MGAVPRALDQPRGRRVQRDGARRSHQAVLAHRHRAEPPLKQMVWRARACIRSRERRNRGETIVFEPRADPFPSLLGKVARSAMRAMRVIGAVKQICGNW